MLSSYLSIPWEARGLVRLRVVGPFFHLVGILEFGLVMLVSLDRGGIGSVTY